MCLLTLVRILWLWIIILIYWIFSKTVYVKWLTLFTWEGLTGFSWVLSLQCALVEHFIWWNKEGQRSPVKCKLFVKLRFYCWKPRTIPSCCKQTSLFSYERFPGADMRSSKRIKYLKFRRLEASYFLIQKNKLGS